MRLYGVPGDAPALSGLVATGWQEERVLARHRRGMRTWTIQLVAIWGGPWWWGLVAPLFGDAVAACILEVIRFPRDTDAGKHGHIRPEARVGLAF